MLGEGNEGEVKGGVFTKRENIQRLEALYGVCFVSLFSFFPKTWFSPPLSHTIFLFPKSDISLVPPPPPLRGLIHYITTKKLSVGF